MFSVTSYSKVNQDVQSHDVLFLIEDFNSRGGNDSECHDKIMERTGLVTSTAADTDSVIFVRRI